MRIAAQWYTQELCCGLSAPALWNLQGCWEERGSWGPLGGVYQVTASPCDHNTKDMLPTAHL